MIGGDLSGFNLSQYRHIETSVAEKVGRVEVYKVNHHGSRYSTNERWLEVTRPAVGIISVGPEKLHGHPTQECLNRLHSAGVKTYWTHSGTGAPPAAGRDVVGGHIRLEVAPAATTFTVTYNGTQTDSYALWEAGQPEPEALPAFAWSRRSRVYHRVGCRYVNSILPENPERGDEPPAGKTLHQGCPVL